MRVIGDVPDAQRLPTRHHFALPRLIALLRFRTVSLPQGIDRVVVAVDPDQSAAEIYAVAIWMFVTVWFYIAAVLPFSAGWATIAGFFLAGIAVQIPFCIAGTVFGPLWNLVTGRRTAHNQKLNSIVFMTLMVIASSYIGTLASPVRYAAWLFFALFLLNAAAWLVLVPLRGRLRELEQRCGL